MRKTNRTWTTRLVIAAALALALGSSTAWATMMSFTATGTNSKNPAEALSAQADFTIDTGVLTITLTNLLTAAQIESAGQALSDISFDLSDDVGVVGTLTAAGQFGDLDIGAGGTVTYVAHDSHSGHTSDTTPVRWLNSPNTSISGTSITLEAIGGGQPSQLILPFVADGGAFPNVNASLGNFNSSVIGPATFTLALSGVSANTTISNVMFSFGTNPDTFVPGVPVPTPSVPEPGELTLLAAGLVALVALRRRSR